MRFLQATYLQMKLQSTNVRLWYFQGCGGGGNWGLEPLSQKPSPLAPNEMTLCIRVNGKLPFLVPVSPPQKKHLPCRLLILISLATPWILSMVTSTYSSYNFQFVQVQALLNDKRVEEAITLAKNFRKIGTTKEQFTRVSLGCVTVVVLFVLLSHWRLFWGW